MMARCTTKKVLAAGLGAATAAMAWAAPARAQWPVPTHGGVVWGYGSYAVHYPVAPGLAFLERPKGGLVITRPPYIRQFVWHPVAVRRPVPILRPPRDRWR